MTTDTNTQHQVATSWRTRTAIGVAAAIGFPVGVFLYATAVPFGPVLLGWFVALMGAIVVTGGLCILATGRYVLVGFSFAAGVAAATVIAGLISPRSVPDWSGALIQFAIVFAIVGVVSLISSGLCALLKWEDKRARQKEK
ncbi:MAG TPA: hypothetical protein VNX28_18315 [Gemmataceae bacterium]|jgi:hypothetical protein|nr:hypothetical protein [Gemmataceae bacterium]